MSSATEQTSHGPENTAGDMYGMIPLARYGAERLEAYAKASRVSPEFYESVMSEVRAIRALIAKAEGR